MAETERLTGLSTDFELGFVEREATPEPAMKLGIQLHAAGLSLSDTVSVLRCWGVDRARSTVHNWVQKAGLQPTGGKSPNHVAVDETVIHPNDQRFWLCAAVDPDTNDFLHVRLFPTRTIVLKTVPAGTDRETRCRRRRLSRRWRTMAPSCPV